MSNNLSSNTSSDFDAQSLVRSVDSHTKEMEALSSRLTNLEERFGSNEKLANTLCEASETALKMRTMLTNVFIDMVKSDSRAKTAFSALVDETDRNKRDIILKQFGVYIITFIGVIVGALLNALSGVVGNLFHR